MRTTTVAQWNVLLTGSEAARARAVVRTIAEGLKKVECVSPELANGLAGLGLFYGYMAKAHPGEKWEETAARLLRAALDGEVGAEHRYSLMHGMTGIAWANAHLRLDLSLDVNDTLTELADRPLLELVETRPWRGVYDAADGLAAYGVYGLERQASAPSNQLLRRIVERLAETALPTRSGVTWWTAPQNLSPENRERYPMGVFNAGAAHGVPGIIVFLARACACDIAADKARPLLEMAIRWLLDQRTLDAAGDEYPDMVPLGRPRCGARKLRVAWCYGDLGVSAALLNAAVLVGNNDWARVAIETARRSAARVPNGSGVDVDGPSVCHGAAGNAHVFNRLYQTTGDHKFRHAAVQWFKYAFTFCRQDDGEDALRFVGRAKGSDEERRIDDPGLFGGAAGIGLTLLAASTNILPEWDRIMSISIRPSAVEMAEPQAF